MKKYDYKRCVTDDIKDYIEECDIRWGVYDRELVEEMLIDDLFTEDRVTGKNSGSYFCTREAAEEALCHNLDLLCEAMEESVTGLGYVMKQGAEACDVAIRCYLLSECVKLAMNEIEWQRTEMTENV